VSNICKKVIDTEVCEGHRGQEFLQDKRLKTVKEVAMNLCLHQAN